MLNIQMHETVQDKVRVVLATVTYRSIFIPATELKYGSDYLKLLLS